MTPFEEGGGGEGGGGGALVINFGGVTYQGATPGGPEGSGDYLVTFNHSGSSPTPHTITFMIRCTHCGINGVSGPHEFTIVGTPDIPVEGFFQVVISGNPLSNPKVNFSNFLGDEGTPIVRDINDTAIPAEYGTPQVIFLNNY